MGVRRMKVRRMKVRRMKDRRMKEKEMKTLTWNDTDLVAQKLMEKYPDAAPFALSEGEIRQKILELEGFNNSPPEQYLDITAITRRWIILSDDTDEEEDLRLFGCDEAFLSDYHLNKRKK